MDVMGGVGWVGGCLKMDVCADVVLRCIRVSGFGVRVLKAGWRFGLEVD